MSVPIAIIGWDMSMSWCHEEGWKMDIRPEARKKAQVPIWQKSNLTIEEAAEYSGIGRNKLRQLSNDDNCSFVLWVGSKRLIKRRELDEFLSRMFSI